MTKERKIAIEMWKYIRTLYDTLEQIPLIDREYDLYDIKHDFLYTRGIKWLYSCWFCQYIRKHPDETCFKCPLRNCGMEDSPYQRVLYSESEEEFITACNEIITALGGNPND